MDKGKICKIRDVFRAIGELEQTFENRFGLNLNEAMMLCTLHEHNGITSGELMERLKLTHSNTSKIIRAIEDRNFIRRSFDKEDKRVIHFSLTKAGIKQLEEIKCCDINIPAILQAIL